MAVDANADEFILVHIDPFKCTMLINDHFEKQILRKPVNFK